MRKVSISKACELPSTRRISPRPSHTCSPRPLCVVFQHRFRGHCQHTSTRLITLEMSLPTVSSISNTVSFKLQLPTMHPPVHPCLHPSMHPSIPSWSFRPSIHFPADLSARVVRRGLQPMFLNPTAHATDLFAPSGLPYLLLPSFVGWFVECCSFGLPCCLCRRCVLDFDE